METPRERDDGRGEGLYIYACSGDEGEREKERGKRDGKGAKQRAAGREGIAGRELFLVSTHDPPTPFAHLALLLSSVSR